MIDKILKDHPMPWHKEYIEVNGTATCHHKTRTWVIVDANSRRVWWTEAVVTAICAEMNAAYSAPAPGGAR